MQSSSWSYQGQPFTDPQSYHGFIYHITYSDGTEYIGKKDFFTSKKLPALKSGIPRPDSTRTYKNSNGSRIYFDIVKQETNWRTYSGSSKLTSNKVPISKEILALASSKRELTYLEVKYLFMYNVLECDSFVNENILGKFFKNNLT